MSFASLHVDSDVWGADAREFKPEGWIGLKQSWNFIPFFWWTPNMPSTAKRVDGYLLRLNKIVTKFQIVRESRRVYGIR
jgi:hypothetical protein